MDQIGSFIDQGEAHNSWGQWWMTKYGHFKINGAITSYIGSISKIGKFKISNDIISFLLLWIIKMVLYLFKFMKWTLKEKGQ